MIVLDTTALSEAFRRRPGAAPPSPAAVAIRRLIAVDAALAVPGIVMQELLSGVRTEAEFHKLREDLAGFSLILATRDHHLHAARIVNACARHGVSCSTVDALIAAITLAGQGELLTTDRDYAALAPHCGLRLYQL
jgi:predicted nucleic acid-binding protein